MDVPFDLPKFSSIDPPDIDTTAPDFTRTLVTEEYWENQSLSDLTQDRSVLLCFHPMIGSFPAIYFWNEVADRDWENEYNVRVVGCTISTPYALIEFIKKRSLPSPIFSDPANTVAERFDIAHDLDGMAGVSEPRPATFLIDHEMTIRHRWIAEEWPEFPPYDAIETALQEI
ncbi:redoxin domain-containing protein [Salinarchaeum sp. IM2453]|uniref:redoxin domain-containing protein n=1 Tax=Salinarchaeum sp. IM2453 TaxID=2862870 RepID=UPI001C83C19C|nr:redoxin domain-containing protein [Salinarchaeum sp. IM2453]QZA88099.1 redoxin domain-containing protein [Salinarchaeum sp. IM2453]